MEKSKDDMIKNQRFILILCILCAASLSVAGVYHLIAFDRPWDYFSAAVSSCLMCALYGVFRKLK